MTRPKRRANDNGVQPYVKWIAGVFIAAGIGGLWQMNSQVATLTEAMTWVRDHMVVMDGRIRLLEFEQHADRSPDDNDGRWALQ